MSDENLNLFYEGMEIPENDVDPSQLSLPPSEEEVHNLSINDLSTVVIKYIQSCSDRNEIIVYI